MAGGTTMPAKELRFLAARERTGTDATSSSNTSALAFPTAICTPKDAWRTGRVDRREERRTGGEGEKGGNEEPSAGCSCSLSVL